jgi:hypothetical protein
VKTGERGSLESLQRAGEVGEQRGVISALSRAGKVASFRRNEGEWSPYAVKSRFKQAVISLGVGVSLLGHLGAAESCSAIISALVSPAQASLVFPCRLPLPQPDGSIALKLFTPQTYFHLPPSTFLPKSLTSLPLHPYASSFRFEHLQMRQGRRGKSFL